MIPIVEWILSRAVQAEYAEKSTFYQRYSSHSKSMNTAGKDKDNTSESTPVSFLQAAWDLLTPICELFQMPPPPGCDTFHSLFSTDAETLTAPLDEIIFAYFAEVSRRVSSDLPQFFRSAEAYSAQKIIAQTYHNDENAKGTETLRAVINEVMTGDAARAKALQTAKEMSVVETGSVRVDIAIGLLRALYNYDIKSLQLAVNKIISQAQDLTAEPSIQPTGARSRGDIMVSQK